MFMSTLFKLVFECNLFVHNWLIIMYVKFWQSEGWLDMVSKMVIELRIINQPILYLELLHLEDPTQL